MKDRPHTGTPFADAITLPRPSDDDRFMREALDEGRLAAGHGDVPIGAAVVRDGFTGGDVEVDALQHVTLAVESVEALDGQRRFGHATVSALPRYTS